MGVQKRHIAHAPSTVLYIRRMFPAHAFGGCICFAWGKKEGAWESAAAAAFGGAYISWSGFLAIASRDSVRDELKEVLPRWVLGAVLLSELRTTCCSGQPRNHMAGPGRRFRIFVMLGYIVLLVWLRLATSNCKALNAWLFLLWVLFAAMFTAAAAVYDGTPLQKRFVWSHACTALLPTASSTLRTALRAVNWSPHGDSIVIRRLSTACSG